jgi:hypothetical protein
MPSQQDQLLASRRATWRGFTRLIVSGAIVSAILTIIAVSFTV